MPSILEKGGFLRMLTLHGIVVFKKPVEPEKRSSPGDSTNARRKKVGGKKKKTRERAQPVITVEGSRGGQVL